MNSIVTIIDGQSVTTSLTIAKGTEVQHKNVLELVRTYQADLEEFGPLAFETRKGESLPQGGFAKSTEVAVLNEHQSTLVLTYMKNTDIVRSFKKRLVKEFWEMAKQLRAISTSPAKLSRMELIQIALAAEEENVALTAALAQQAPKVQALDRIATVSEGSFCIRDAAKTLQVQEKKLKQFLIEHQWTYRRPMGAGTLAYSDKLQKGLMEHKMTKGEKSDGSEWVDTQARITAKGIARLAEMLADQAVAA